MMLKNLLNLRTTASILTLLTLLFFGGSIYAQESCGNDAGIMPEAFFPACAGNFVTTTSVGATVATANSSLIYILHSGPDNTAVIIPDSIKAFNTSGIFYNDGSLPTNQDLFISAYVGPLNANGSPILNDVCADVALPGTPIRFYKPLELMEISSTCDPVSGCLTVEFTISGGAPNFPGNDLFFEYKIEGDYSGVIDNLGDIATFTLCDTEGYVITVEDDGKGCEATFNVASPCTPCNNDAGPPQPIQLVCSGASASGETSGGSADPNASTVYYLHSGDINNPIDQNLNGTFINGGTYPTNTQLFITAAVGPNGADLSDPCTDVQGVGSPVVFLTPISVTSSYTCDEVTGTSTVSYTVGGGQPAFDGSSYTIGGTPGATSVGVGTHTFTIPEGTGTYTISATDGAGCEGGDAQPYTCEGCDNDAGTPNPPQVVCSGGSANGANGTETVDPGSGLVYALHTGTPAGILATNATGTFVNDGTFPTNQQLYISAAVGELGANGLPDLNDPCSDIDLPGTSVIFLTAVTGSSSTVCDDVTGTTTVTYSFSGGLPAFDGSAYTISGDATGSATAGQSLTFTLPEGTGTYTVTATDGNSCTGNTDGSYNCVAEVFDLALIKEIAAGQTTPIYPGDDVTFTITVTNQGTIPASNFTITDYIPTGMSLNDADWTAAGAWATFTMAGPLAPGASTSVDITLTVTSTSAGDLVNYAEISNASGVTPNGATITDSDSTADGDNTNDAGGVPNSGTDNTINNEGGDEDDHDPALITVDIFDLALVKVVAAGQPSLFVPGDNVTFDITVSNQGTVTAQNIEIIDHIPAGLSLNDADWTAAGSTATTTIAGPIAAGGSATVSITLTIDTATPASLTNFAEITSAQDENGNTPTDIDSVGDNDPNNDTVVDDETGNAGGDEDDSDIAIIEVGCSNDAGDVPQTPLVICFNDVASSTSTGSNLQPGAGLFYALHDAANAVGNILEVNQTGSFTNNGTYVYNTQYYISPVAAANVNGAPDLTDPCLDVTLPGTPVVFLAPVEGIVTETTCDDVSGTTTVSYSFSGGLPAFNGSSFTISGSDSGSAGNGETLTITFSEGAGNYTISAADGNGCSADITGAYNCDGCNNAPGTPNAAQFVCSGGSVNGYVSDPLIDRGGITYALHDGSTSVGTIYGVSSNSQFINDGSYPTNTQLYISSIVGPDNDGDGVPDLTDPCTVVQLPGSPVVFLNPIEGTATTSCDDATGIATVTYSFTGGLPEFDGSAYTYTGADGSGSLNITGGGSYNIGASDGAGCSGVVSGSYTCEPEVFDLALIKEIAAGQTTPIYPGDDVTFTITVTNQGTVSASNFTITDYIPTGMSLNDTDWTASGVNATITMAGPLAPGASTSVDITLTVTSTTAGDLVNFAEISSATGVTPGGTTITDIDSTPDNIAGNDSGGLPNSPSDNSIGGNGTGTPGIGVGETDEDDHDPALISVDIFDLAIAKDLAPGTPSTLLPGDNVTFVVTVTNEGTVAAQNIDLVDYVPAGLTLNDAAWTLQADGTATNTIPGPIAAGGSASVNITFTIDAGFSGQIRNVVEIAGAEDTNGNTPDDIDSTPGNGDNNEDDVDDEIINIAVFDLALTKVVAAGQASLFVPGDDVTFTITVYNQGTVDAFNVQIIDHIPADLSLNDAGWVAGAGNTATASIPGPVAAGSSATINITLTVNTSTPGDLTNFAEITSAQDPNGNTPTDVDSTGDTDPGNDTIVDNEINNGGGDEDDSDIAVIAVGCSNDAGDVPQSPVALCAGQSTTVTSTGSSLADGAGLFYALHDAANAVGNIIAVNQTGTFVNDGTYTYGVQYYISPVAAQVVSGAPDLTDPCLDVTLPGTPVIFYAPVVITPGAVNCDMVTGEYTASFTISGGSGSYTISGDYSGTTTGGGFTFVDNGDGNISLNVVDGAGCTADYNTTYMCMGCDNDPGILQPFNEPICFGDSYGFSAVGASAQSGAVLYYVLTDNAGGIGTIYEANSTGVFTHDGIPAYPTNTQLYVYSVVGVPGAMGIPNLSDPCTVISNPPAAVGFLDPVVINHNYICDNSVGEIVITFDIAGGGPAFPGSGHTYTVTGSYNGVVSPGQVITVGPLSDGESYNINVVSDGKSCSASYVSPPLQCDKLPVELMSFDGEVQQSGNYLKWITASEINNDYFIMERSNDGGQTYVKIGGAIKGAGTTPNQNKYNLLDREAPSGTSIYKLSQTDFDGTTEVIGVVELTRGEATLAIIDIFPIPVDNLMNVQISSNTDNEVNVTITDMLGRTIYSELQDVNMDLNELQISTNSFASGVYFLSIESSDYLVTQKFVKE